MNPNMTKTLKPGTRGARTLSMVRSTADPKKRTVEVAFSSETPVVHSWGIEILDHSKKSVRLGRLQSGGPLLADHDTADIVGVVESARIGSDLIGRAVVRFGKSARAEEVFQDVLGGIRKNVSVGYLIHDAEEVKSKDSSLPTFRVTDWEPLEISLAAVPADPNVGVNRTLGKSPVIEIPIKARSQEQEKMETQQFDNEKQRVSDILTIGQDHKELELASRAVREGTSLAEFLAMHVEAVSTPRGALERYRKHVAFHEFCQMPSDWLLACACLGFGNVNNAALQVHVFAADAENFHAPH